MTINKGSTVNNVFPETTISASICTLNINVIVTLTVSGALLELMQRRMRKFLTADASLIKEVSKRYFTLPGYIAINKNTVKRVNN